VPDIRSGELGLERGKPGVVELDLTALEQLPCASVVGAFLDGEIDVTNGNPILRFIVENCLERADDLLHVSIGMGACETGRTSHTTTPPISKRTALGGLDDCLDMTMRIVWCR
jgi:hypothetical protein